MRKTGRELTNERKSFSPVQDIEPRAVHKLESHSLVDPGGVVVQIGRASCRETV